ncbi:MAG: GNAT family N-acetyltransferase [Candidatus Thorarchaeota archaeon]|nr:GNAT family N-acetyltransferase [Candidatus Thorarchaeota archaeon]
MKTWEFECKDGESVFIRHARLSDGQNMFEGFAEVVAEKKWLPTLDTTTSLAQWFDWIERSKDTDDVILVALIDGHYVGHLTLRPERWDASEHVCRLGIIVRKPYRNTGVGKALMTASEEAAHDAGFEKIVLSTLSNNTTAIALYRSMKYREIGIRRNHFKMPNGYVNQVLFEKLLQ